MPRPIASLTDDELVDVLTHGCREHDAVPPLQWAAAHGAWLWRTVDDDLAELLSDSATMQLEAVRGAHTAETTLVFSAGGALIVLATAADVLRGQISPGPLGMPVGVWVESAATGSRQSVTLSNGGFLIAGLTSGATRLRITHSDGTGVATSWFRLG